MSYNYKNQRGVFLILDTLSIVACLAFKPSANQGILHTGLYARYLDLRSA